MDSVKNKINILVVFSVLLLLFGCVNSDFLAKERQSDAVHASDKTLILNEPKKIDFSVGELKLSQLTGYAQKNSPELRSIYASWQASVNRAPQEASLPDPKLNYGYFIESVQTKTGPQDHKIGISQTVPWFGKLSLKEKMAVKEAEAVYQKYEQARRNVVREIAKAYYEYSWLHSALQINRDHVELLKVVELVASIRFKSGQISQSSLVQIQVEQGKIEDRIKELDNLKAPISASIYAAMGLEAGVELPAPGPVGVPFVLPDTADLKESVVLSSPRLEKLRLLKQREDMGVRLSEKNYYPDLTFGLSYIETDGGDDPTLALVSVNLPIWRKSLDASKREAVNRRESVNENLHSTRLQLMATLDLHVYHYQNSVRKRKLYEDTLIPKARQSIDLAVKGFETGSVNFSELLDAERTLLEFQLEAKRYIANAYQRVADIEALAGIGGDFADVSKKK